MPCSTLALEVIRPSDAISGNRNDDSGSLPKGTTSRQWLPVENCPLVASGSSTSSPPDSSVTRIPLPDVNSSSFQLAVMGSSPNSGSFFDLHPSSDGQSGKQALSPIPDNCQSESSPSGSNNRQRTKTRRKKAKCRDKVRNRKKKLQPEETRRIKEDIQPTKRGHALKRKQLESVKPQTQEQKHIENTHHRLLSKAHLLHVPRTPENGIPSALIVMPPSGSPGVLKPKLSRAVSVQAVGEDTESVPTFEVESGVRLPRIARVRNDVTASATADLSLKKCASNPEISSKGNVIQNGERKTKKAENTSALGHLINKDSPVSQLDEKKKPQVALLIAIKPENQESERERFFKQRYNYNPQFTYRYPANPVVLEKYSHPTSSLLPVAEKIMNHAIEKYGSFEKFVETTGGKKLNRSQIVESAKRYLKKEGMLDEVAVRLSEDILSRACMTRFRGQPTLQVRINEIRELWMEGLLRHELGTHYIRSSNNRNQEWYKWRRRRELNLRPFNPTEEGIAALHSIISRPEPSLFRSALLYYTAFKASELSFSQLFKDLGKFVKDPNVRWDYCMRAKRGQTDTSLPGTFSKDQVYLTGALSILKHRVHIDFHALFRCGKVDFRDVDRLKDLADLQNTRIPGFMIDLKQYRRSLDEIVVRNGLTNSDLEAAV